MSEKTFHFLDPKHRLVDEVVAWLGARLRTEAGVRSLAHLLVIVPTAQSGRTLRLALARTYGAVLPPRITMANLLLEDTSAAVATSAEERAMLAGVLLARDPKRTQEGALAWAGTLLALYEPLGERALLFGEVTPPEDAARWQELAAIERDFLAALHAAGLISRAEARRAAVQKGLRARPGEEGLVEEVVLPAAVDVQPCFTDFLAASPVRVSVLLHAAASERDRFDDWGRPCGSFVANVPVEAIHAEPSSEREAEAVARYFRAVKPAEALPALVIASEDLYPELEGAFQNHFDAAELALRNPAREPLATSALGRLVLALLAFTRRADYETLSTLLRTGDVQRWAAQKLKVTPAEIAARVGKLDAVQNRHLPRTLEETQRAAAADEAADLGQLLAAVETAAADPWAWLAEIFASLTLDAHAPGDRELVAATEVVRAVREACASPHIAPALQIPLLMKLLAEATFSLEPTAPNILTARGTLELSWCAEAEIVIAGMNEGAFPASLVGHPFLPDSLRARLGLMTNERRAARDSYLFAEALRCRAPRAVQIHLHQLAGDRSVLKPSRLLFPGVSDKDLPALARRLYAVTKGGEGAPASRLPSAWRLKLPRPPAEKTYRARLSVTRLDNYLNCPFEFYLTELFGEHPEDRLQELDERAFGTLVHQVLETFAERGPKESEDPAEIARFLSGAVHAELASFAVPLPAIIELQGEAAIARLTAFAAAQAAWHRAGWRIVASERSLRGRLKTCPTVLTGRLDRLDRNVATGQLAIIDYKTWKAPRPDLVSVQLPLYRTLLEASGLGGAAAADALALYCVLGERAEDTLFDLEHAARRDTQGEAEQVAVDALERLARGIFYPPGRTSYWVDHYGVLTGPDLEEALDADWLADQRRRIEEAAI